MLKKLIILILILAVVGVATVPLWSSKRAEWAFENPGKRISPGIVKDAMIVKKRIQRYEKARELAEKGYLYWPHSRELRYFLYNAAYCAEQERKPYVAIFWYEKFLKRYPKDEWSKQAENRLKKLKELNSIE